MNEKKEGTNVRYAKRFTHELLKVVGWNWVRGWARAEAVAFVATIAVTAVTGRHRRGSDGVNGRRNGRNGREWTKWTKERERC